MNECKPQCGGGQGVPGGGRGRELPHGRVVQVDSIKPTLKAPGTKRLKLFFDERPSEIAFKFNVRHCRMEATGATPLIMAALKGKADAVDMLLSKVGPSMVAVAPHCSCTVCRCTRSPVCTR